MKSGWPPARLHMLNHWDRWFFVSCSTFEDRWFAMIFKGEPSKCLFCDRIKFATNYMDLVREVSQSNFLLGNLKRAGHWRTQCSLRWSQHSRKFQWGHQQMENETYLLDDCTINLFLQKIFWFISFGYCHPMYKICICQDQAALILWVSLSGKVTSGMGVGNTVWCVGKKRSATGF